MKETHERLLYEEEQVFPQWWVWAIVLLVAALGWWTFLQQIVRGVPFGSNPAPDWLVWVILVLCGVALPFFFLRSRLITTLTRERLQVHLRFIRRRVIPLGDIRSAEALTYRPIRQYGGWGIRYNAVLGWAYTAHGRHGVHLRLENGRGLLVGSQRPDALLKALADAGVEIAAEARG